MNDTAPSPSVDEPQQPGETAPLVCPLCKSTRFVALNGRENARCASCQSVERTRLLFLVLERFESFRPGLRVFHVTPELAFLKRFSELNGERYHACDLEPVRQTSRYTTIRPIDLCTDLAKFPSRCFDVIIHSHVLNQVRCGPEPVLAEMERLLAPGGHHFLSVPIAGERSREMSPESAAPGGQAPQATQRSNFRVFGSLDFPKVLDRAWGKKESHQVAPLELFHADELRKAAIPQEVWSGLSSHSVFHRHKPLRRTVKIAFPPRPDTGDPIVGEAARTPRTPVPARPDVVLHIGLPNLNSEAIQTWILNNRYGALRGGLEYWPIADNHSEAAFYAFARPERIGRGTMWFQQENPLPEFSPDEYRAKFDRFVDGLDGGTGFVSADVMWAFAREDIARLGAHLEARDVSTRILCWVRPPAELLSTMLRHRCRSGLLPADFGVRFASTMHIDFRRLDAWIDQFGMENIDLRMLEGDGIAQLAALLERFDIEPPTQAGLEPSDDARAGYVGGKALLAFNLMHKSASGDAARRPRRMRDILDGIKGPRFVLPETIVSRMTQSFQEEAAYLAERFSLSLDDLLPPIECVDDPAFFAWDMAEVATLIEPLSEAMSRGEEGR